MIAPQLKHDIQQWKAESIFSKIRKKIKSLTFTTFIQYAVGRSCHSNQTSKRNKRHKNAKERSKLSLFAETVTVCRWHDTVHRNTKYSTKELLLSLNLVKLQDTKLIHRNLLYFYTLAMNSQKEKFEKKSHWQWLKYLGIDLT